VGGPLTHISRGEKSFSKPATEMFFDFTTKIDQFCGDFSVQNFQFLPNFFALFFEGKHFWV
jgi:hypothetical protein